MIPLSDVSSGAHVTETTLRKPAQQTNNIKRTTAHRGSSQLAKTRTRLTTACTQSAQTQTRNIRGIAIRALATHQPCHARRVCSFHFATHNVMVCRLPPHHSHSKPRHAHYTAHTRLKPNKIVVAPAPLVSPSVSHSSTTHTVSTSSIAQAVVSQAKRAAFPLTSCAITSATAG